MNHLARRSALWLAGLVTLAFACCLLIFALFDFSVLLDAGRDIGPCYSAKPRGMIALFASTVSGFALPVLLAAGLISLRRRRAGHPKLLIGVDVVCFAALLVGYGAETCDFIGIFNQYGNGDGLEPLFLDVFAMYTVVAAAVAAVSVQLLRRRRA